MNGDPVSPSSAADITLLTQIECALCEQAKDVLNRVRRDHRLTVREIDLASAQGTALAVRHGLLFAPGVLINGHPFSHGRLSERKLRRHLERTASAATTGDRNRRNHRPCYPPISRKE